MANIRYSWFSAEAPGLGRVDFAARIETTRDETFVSIDDAIVAGARLGEEDLVVDPFELGIRTRGGWAPLADYLREVALDAIASEPR